MEIFEHEPKQVPLYEYFDKIPHLDIQFCDLEFS